MNLILILDFESDGIQTTNLSLDFKSDSPIPFDDPNGQSLDGAAAALGEISEGRKFAFRGAQICSEFGVLIPKKFAPGAVIVRYGPGSIFSADYKIFKLF